MTEAQAAAAATALPEAEVEGEVTVKEAIYIKIGELVKEKTGKRIGKTGGRDIFDMICHEVFAAAAKEGTIRFNGGLGSFHIKTYQAGTRRLPSGQSTTFGLRKKMRYEEGVVVKELVANGGNLEEAIKARGSRAPKVETVVAAKANGTAAAKPTETVDDLNLD